MSIIDLIIEHQLILMTLIFAMAPLLVAAAILISSRVRKHQAEQKEALKRRALRRRAMQEIEARNRQAQLGAATLTGKAQGSAEVEVEEEEEEITSDEDDEDAPSAEMQSILADVFATDEDSNNHDILLEGVQTVNLDDLMSLSASLATRLNNPDEPAAQ